MNSPNYDLLLIILSTGFVVLIIFVCVALGAMIKIMMDIKRITEVAKREAEKIDEMIDTIGDKAKSIFTNSVILEKIVPAVLGAISVGLGAKKAMDHYDERTTARKKQPKKKKRGTDIFSYDEVD